MVSAVILSREAIKSFPSPCGDVVLKFHRFGFVQPSRSIVSVPLRGCGFEIQYREVCIEYRRKRFPSPCGDVVLKCLYCRAHFPWSDTVSVPLRGCGFEILARDVLADAKLLVFPSPCGDVVLKSVATFGFSVASSQSFRPLAGMWF